jgi:fatty acid-binding protein DegV
MSLVLGGLVYADGDLSPEELVLRSASEPVSTSAPSPGDFLEAIARSTEHEESRSEVLVLTVSFNERHLRGGAYRGKLRRRRRPARHRHRHCCRSVAHDARLMATLRNLDHLARSGRVPQAAAWAGRAVGVQVMFEFAGGKARPRRPARTERSALERMVATMVRSRPRRTEAPFTTSRLPAMTRGPKPATS